MYVVPYKPLLTGCAPVERHAAGGSNDGVNVGHDCLPAGPEHACDFSHGRTEQSGMCKRERADGDVAKSRSGRKRGHIRDGGCDPSDIPQPRQHIGTRIDRQHVMAKGCETPRMATGSSRNVDRQPRLQLIDQSNDS